MINIPNATKPYINFERRSVEDRNETLKLGKKTYKSVNFAMVMQPGSRDVTEKIAEEWITQIKRAALDNKSSAYPLSWVHEIEAGFTEWQKGNELPESGTPLRMWPAISPAECENILAANVRTVEDLAALNESGLGMIGMGGRELQERARTYLKAASGGGVIAEENNALKARIADLERKIDALMSNQPIETKRKPGRPKKDE